MEQRTLALTTELRNEDPEHPRRLRGVAVVYGQLADIAGKFHERINAGALTRSLASGHNIKARFEHRDLLGSTANNTLRLHDTPEGLAVEVDVAETRAGDDALTLVKRGDIRGMSFGFNVPRNGQRFIRTDGKLVRDIFDLDLHEITVTDSPAYTGTSVSLRSVDPDAMAQAEAVLSAPTLTDRRNQLRQLQAA